MSTRSLVRAVLLSLIGVAALVGATNLAYAAPPTTRVLYQPFANASGALAPGYHVVRRANGYCFTGSDASQRANSYRCFLGKNMIVDPCFSTPSNTDVGWVACPTENPFHGAIARLQLTQKLPSSPAAASTSTRFPFAVRLALGRTCWLSTGADGTLQGRLSLYYCAGDGALGAKIYETGTHWTAWFLPSPHGTWRRVAVREAAF